MQNSVYLARKRKKKVKNKNLKVFYLTAIVAFVMDQISKIMVIHYVGRNLSSLDIFKYFSLTVVKNTGICFGILSRFDIKHFIVIASLAIAVFIFIYLYRQKEKTICLQLSLGLIEGGIAGNMADRIRVNAVIDFINLHIWPIFNMADVFIVSGICIMLLGALESEKRNVAVH